MPVQGVPPPLQPAKLADFKLAGALGSGTTAKVYEAVHVTTGRQVAIKILEPSQSGSEMRERFAREAILLAGVASKHVGNIVGFGFERGQPFLVLERLTGETLDAKLRRDGPVPLPVAVRWIEQLLIGVRDCHDQQIIHRDIMPANIFLHKEGFDETVKLIDFGVARLREITGDTAGLTSTNHLIGSMGYMAPEQFRNAKTVGFSADLYAIGVVIFRTLTGRLPFVSRSLEAVIKMKAEHPAPEVSSMPGMPKNVLLDWFVTRALAREPAERFQHAREMLEHWWNVMASLDDDDTTDVMRGIGRVDESYAGPLQRSMRGPDLAAPPVHIEVEEDRTLRRMVPAAPIGSVRGAAPSSVRGPAPSSGADLTLHDMAPNTEPSPHVHVPSATAGAVLDDDPFDMPTKSDPNLRKLVEQELELQRKRRGPPR
ncbi:MAG: serine/threonine protein kinase [Labilithrix sp.]|nr:serine/threonine protein kinase [Labilithrix sp.]